MLKKVISGGQTGADRAALDVAIKLHIPHGGWIPKGRIAEDGPLPDKYELQEMPTDSYPARTEQNVIDSDGTLLLSHGALTGGSAYTRKMAMKHQKPWFHIDLNRTPFYQAGVMITMWIFANKIEVLNVAGPRASKDPVIYDKVFAILEQVYFLSMLKHDNPELFGMRQQVEQETAPAGLPQTVDEAVDQILAEMSAEEKRLVANTTEEGLEFLSQLLTAFLETKLQDSTANRQLYEDCKVKAGNPDLGEAEAAKVIVRQIWKKVRETHRLRVVK